MLLYGEKGSGDYTNPIKPVAGGLLPEVFNYMVGASYSFPLMEYFPLKAQKQMARSNELAAKADFELAIQVLEKKDARARILLAQSRQVADETPILVQAAKVREEKSFKTLQCRVDQYGISSPGGESSGRCRSGKFAGSNRRVALNFIAGVCAG